MFKVKNVVGSGRFPAPNGYVSWLDYWEKMSGFEKRVCGATNCCNTDLVGAHVQKVNGTDKSWYITPLCRKCNQRTDTFDVHWPLIPVPSNL